MYLIRKGRTALFHMVLILIVNVTLGAAPVFSAFINDAGDLNDNGQVDAGDSVLAEQYLLGQITLDAIQQARLNIAPLGAPNADINVGDLILLKRVLLEHVDISELISLPDSPQLNFFSRYVEGGTTTITGQTTPNIDVRMYVDDVLVGTTTSDGSGLFTFNLNLSNPTAFVSVRAWDGDHESVVEEQIVVNAPTPTDPGLPSFSNDTYWGRLQGDYRVNADGSFGYIVPLELVPGINNFKPSLNLIYNSNLRNGSLGWGWALDGLSRIEICPANLVKDGIVSGIQPKDVNEFKFCMDGQRLVEVADNEFRLEKERFSRITRIVGMGTVDYPQYWEVIQKNGEIWRYGDNNAAQNSIFHRITKGPPANPTYEAEPAIWWVNRQTDIAGNYIEYFYERPNVSAFNTNPFISGLNEPAHRIQRIEYTKNPQAQDVNQKILFEYEARSDVIHRYVAQQEEITHERLSTIRVQSNAVDVYIYKLNYQQPGNTYFSELNDDPKLTSRIAEIEKCFRIETQCAKSLEFDWQINHPLTFVTNDPDTSDDTIVIFQQLIADLNAGSTDGTIYVSGRLSADFTGDGLLDHLMVSGTNSNLLDNLHFNPLNVGGTQLSLVEGQLGVLPGQLNVTPITTVQSAINHQISGGSIYTSERFFQTMDINSDGRMDLIYMDAHLIEGIDVYISDGTSLVLDPSYSISSNDTSCTVSWVAPSGSTLSGTICYRVEIQDFNGDGLIDVLRYPSYIWDHNANVSWQSDISVALNNGSGFSSFSSWGDASVDFFGAVAEDPILFFRDVTGDGLPDIISTALATEAAFASADFGGVSINMSAGSDGTSNARFAPFVSWEGSGFNTIGGATIFDQSVVDWSMSQLISNKYTNMGDINGDGLADIVRIQRNFAPAATVGVFVNYSTGLGFSSLQFWGEVALPGNEPATLRTSFADTEKDISPNSYVAWLDNDLRRCCRFNLFDYDLDGRDDLVVNLDNTFGLNQAVFEFEESVLLAASNSFAPERITLFLPGNASGNSFGPRYADHDQDGFVTAYELTISPAKQEWIEGVYQDGQNLLSVAYAPFAQQKIYTPAAVSATAAKTDNFIQNGSLNNGEVGVFSTGLTTLGQTISSALNARYGVASIKENDFVGSDIDKSYHYSGAKRHLSGFGSLGFETFEETLVKPDENGVSKALITKSRYIQVVDDLNRYVLRGRPLEQTLEISDVSDDSVVPPVLSGSPSMLSHKRTRWKIRDYNADYDTTRYGATFLSPHWFAYAITRSEERWDLTGTPINQSRTFNNGSTSTGCTPITNENVGETLVGGPGDVNYSLNGTLLFSKTNTCDTLPFGQVFRSRRITQSNLIDASNRLDLPQRVEETRWIGTFSETRTTDFTYYLSNTSGGYASQTQYKIIEPDSTDSDIQLTTQFFYDEYGYPERINEYWSNSLSNGLDFTRRDIQPRHTHLSNGDLRVLTYDYISSLTNVVITDSRFDRPIQQTNHQGFITKMEYDDAGRPETILLPTKVGLPDGSLTTEFQYLECDTPACFAQSNQESWFQVSKTSGSAPLTSYFDELDRLVGSKRVHFDGTDVSTAQTYDTFGRIASSSDPFFGGATQHTTTFSYDELDRNRLTTLPGAVTATNDQTTSYDGLQTTVINREGQSHVQWAMSSGQVVQSLDDLNTAVDFTYHPFGELATTKVDNQAATEVVIGYDIRGRKISLDDPDLGTITYKYNPLNLLASETDAKGQEIRYRYDAMGRQIGRDDVGVGSGAQVLTHTWEYETGSGPSEGLLISVEGKNTDGSDFSETYSYTDRGLLDAITRNYKGATYQTTTLYDSFNRPAGMIYPSNFVVLNEYNSLGYLSSVELPDDTELWRTDAMDARGNLTQTALGNGAITNSTFEPFTGRIATINASVGATSIQNHSYAFSALGNLESRTDNLAAITQSFCYDNLNRLKAARFDGCSSGTTDFSYNELGNILTKAGVAGSYAYGANGAGVHAVTSTGSGATLANYVYDDNGDLISKTSNGVTATLAYSLFGKPIYMGSPTDNTAIIYNPNKKRISRIDSDGRNTVYVGSNYEVTSKNGLIEATHYIDDFAYYIERSDNNNELIYLHRDHLGSLVAKSDATVASMADVQLMANGPWGLRKVDQWDGIDSDGGLESEGATRGFTGHEHLDAVGLIHMNGRVYDPAIGRFVSADPFVQSPENTQSYNRYSYVMNNPLSYTDPSGFQRIDESYTEARRPGSSSFISSFGGNSGGFRPEPVGMGMSDGALLGLGLAMAAGQVMNSDSADEESSTKEDEGSDDSSELSDSDASEGNNEETLLDFLKNSLSETAGGGPSGNEPNNDKDKNKLPDNAKDMKELSKGEIKKLKKGREDIHDLKGKGSSRYDLFKDKDGEVYQVLKGGKGEPQPTYLNINNF